MTARQPLLIPKRPQSGSYQAYLAGFKALGHKNTRAAQERYCDRAGTSYWHLRCNLLTGRRRPSIHAVIALADATLGAASRLDCLYYFYPEIFDEPMIRWPEAE